MTLEEVEVYVQQREEGVGGTLAVQVSNGFRPIHRALDGDYGKISRADVANFLLEEVTGNRYLHAKPTISC